MITPELIARINELAQKQRCEPLTVAEKEEQTTLRRMYIDSIKAQVKASLDAAKCTDHPHTDGCGCQHEH